MTRQLILGTAGHIDHGKTALVRALTGVDTDRLPEEKQRGMTIDLGFARMDAGDVALGIVDVPGHERFIRNMLAGAAGVDLAMLVVAADDSVMPQTREHLEILELMGVERGLVALTKCDLVDDELVELAEMEVRGLVAGTFLEAVPIIRTSAITGQGIEALRAALTDLCAKVESQAPGGLFRLAVDRSFVMPGQGTVVTGSVTGGSAHIGDELDWLPRRQTVRIRSLESHGRHVERVQRGQRAAIGLVGAHHRDIVRGHELASPGFLKPSRIVTVELRVLASSPAPVKHRMRVRLHLGTGAVAGTVSLPTCNSLEAGESALVQIVLAEPIVATCGQPFVIRRLSPVTTLGGGRVLQPAARRIRRKDTASLANIDALRSTNSARRAAAAIRGYGIGPWTPLDLCRDANLNPDEAEHAMAQLETDDILIALPVAHGQPARMHRDALDELQARILHAIEQHHQANPLDTAMDRSKLIDKRGMKDHAALIHAVTDRLAGAGRIQRIADRVALAGFRPELTDRQQAAYDRVITTYRSAGFRPPLATELAAQLDIAESMLRTIHNLAVDRGELAHLGGGLFLGIESERELRTRVTEALRRVDGMTVSEIRQVLDTSRKFAVPFCEYLDRIGVTKRRGDQRVLAT